MQTVDPSYGMFIIGVIFTVINTVILGFTYILKANAGDSVKKAHDAVLAMQTKRNQILEELNRIVESSIQNSTDQTILSQEDSERKSENEKRKQIVALHRLLEILKNIHSKLKQYPQLDVLDDWNQRLLDEYLEVIPNVSVDIRQLEEIIGPLREVTNLSSENFQTLKLDVEGLVFLVNFELNIRRSTSPVQE